MYPETSCYGFSAMSDPTADLGIVLDPRFEEHDAGPRHLIETLTRDACGDVVPQTNSMAQIARGTLPVFAWIAYSLCEPPGPK